jgi:hypothetical protein
VQTYGAFLGINPVWNNVGSHHGLAESTESITPSATIRGGWRVGGAITHGYFAFDPSLYSGLTIEQSTGTSVVVIDTVAFVVPPPEKGLWGGSLSLTTPTYRHFTGGAAVTSGEVPIFREASPGDNTRIDASLDIRPTSAIRTSLQFSRLTIDRSWMDALLVGDDSATEDRVQVSPPIFVRSSGNAARSRSCAARSRWQSDSRWRSGGYWGVSNEFSTDWLFSYRPVQDARVPGLRLDTRGAARVSIPGYAAHERRFLKDQLSLSL